MIEVSFVVSLVNFKKNLNPKKKESNLWTPIKKNKQY